jgi:hypothetical protein
MRQEGVRARFSQRIVERAKQQCQRRAELVTDVGQESCFRAVQFGQGVGSLSLLLVGGDGCYCRGQLVGEQLAKCAVLPIQRAERVRSDHERPGGQALPHRQHQCLVRTIAT